MIKSIVLKVFLCFILFISLISLSPFTLINKAATSHIGRVDLDSGTLNVRNGPGINYKKIGILRNKTEVKVYNQTKSGWSEIRYNKKKAYVSTQFLRFDRKMSLAEAKKITDKVIDMQRKTWERNYTKKEIYSIMGPGYETSYIDKYFKQQMRTAGKTKNGTQLYHVIETEIWGYAIDKFDWKSEYSTKKPTISYYVKNGKEYLVVSQFLLNEESGDHTSTLYLSRSNSKKSWKVYKYTREYTKSPQSANEAVQTWAKAVKLRNGTDQFTVLSKKLQAQTKQKFEELNWVTGLSSPWVDKYSVLNSHKTDKGEWTYTIEFRLATSTGYAGSVKAYLTVEQLNIKWVITGIKGDGSNNLESITVVPSNP